MGGAQRSQSRPLLGGATRRAAAVLLACCAALIAILGLLFAHQASADGFDRRLDSPVITWFAGHQGLGQWLMLPGSPLAAAVLSVAIVVACLLGGRLNGAVLAAAAVPVADGLNDGLLKDLVDRTYRGVLTYPSGHTTAVFTLAATVSVLLLRPAGRDRPHVARILVSALACVTGIVVATALVGLRFHYVTDTLAGAAVGIGTVCGLALLIDLPAARRRLEWLVRRLPPVSERRSSRYEPEPQNTATTTAPGESAV
jgi:membrane-associated phospholipid phosphatase